MSAGEPATFDPNVENLRHWRWRLNNLYVIQDEGGRRVMFRENWAQADFLDSLHNFNLILKSRQLGFTTLIQLLMLDAALFNSDIHCATIAHRLDAAKDIFGKKVRFPYENLPEGLRQVTPLIDDSAREISFPHGSSLMVDATIRSGTFQYLHVSEHGKLCAQFPDKARELRTGALNTVHVGQMVFIESTAEGRDGDFFEFAERARKLALSGAPLSKLDFKFHFYPWFREPDYAIPAEHVMLTRDDEDYFEDLRLKHGIVVSPEQMAWYVKKRETQGDDMGKEFPSTPEEAFAARLEGAFYAREMALIRQNRQICNVPWESRVPVHTFWDLGMDDMTAIWFFQKVGQEYRFIDFYENNGEGFAHYAKVLRDKPYVYGTHHMPHDIEAAELGSGQTRKRTAEGFGIRPIKTVPRTDDLADDIQQVRNLLPKCWFDERKCAKGILGLESYRREWDDKLGTYKSRPRHDQHSHRADAFRCFACGWREPAATWGKRLEINRKWVR